MSYSLNTFVNRQEVPALKEMIFNRARERAQMMSENAQADIMEIARDSFSTKNNPFAQIIKEREEAVETAVTPEVSATSEEKHPEEIVKTNSADTVNEAQFLEIGFPQKSLAAQYTPRAVQQNKVINQQVSASTIYNNMNDAREGLSRKKGFMGALEFLNAQAAVSLARTRADRFEVMG